MLEYKVCIGDSCQSFKTCFALNKTTILEAILTHLQRLRANTCSEGIRNHSKGTGKEIKPHKLRRNSRVNLIQPSAQRRDNADQVAQGLVQSSFE